jgi:TonB family protein
VDLPDDRGELHPKRLHLHPKVLHNRLEYNLYMNALGKPDPQQKAAAMEEFVALYPHSKMKIDALEQAMGAYQASGNAAKVAELAARVLQAEPGNVRALAVLVFLARDCAARDMSAGKNLFQLAQRGLAALPAWQKEQGASLPDGEKLRDEMAVIFAGAAGLGALHARDYAAARQFYEKALASGSKNLQDLYQLAIADLEMSPIDPNGFWYCGKAISIAQLQNKAAAGSMSPYCKARFKRHGGKLEEWDRLVSNTEKDTAPPRDFAKSLSLQEPDQSLPKTPVVVAPLASSEKGDPMTRLVPGTDKDSPIGAGVGSGAAGGAATEPPGQRPEIISLSNNSLPSGDFASRYAWYVQHVQRTVAAAWHVPELTIATDRPVEISFEIEPDGAPTNVRIGQSSGSPALDMSALRAIQRIDKFSPPPTQEKIIVKFVFDSRDKK